MAKLRLFALATVALMTLALGSAAYADNIHLCDVSTGCTSSNVIAISGSTTTAYVSGNPTGEELFLAFLTPVADASGNWNDNGTTLWSVLGVGGGSTYPNLNSAISQELIGTGMTALSFNVSDLDLGTTWDFNPQTITLPGEPVGTIYMAFTETEGNLGLVTPWSSSLVNVPEPSTMTLLAGGLIGLALFGRKALLA